MKNLIFFFKCIKWLANKIKTITKKAAATTTETRISRHDTHFNIDIAQKFTWKLNAYHCVTSSFLCRCCVCIYDVYIACFSSITHKHFSSRSSLIATVDCVYSLHDHCCYFFMFVFFYCGYIRGALVYTVEIINKLTKIKRKTKLPNIHTTCH